LTKQKERPFSFYERDKQKQKLDPEEYLPYDLRKPNFKANPIRSDSGDKALAT
jgi:hypothetical protein